MTEQLHPPVPAESPLAPAPSAAAPPHALPDAPGASEAPGAPEAPSAPTVSDGASAASRPPLRQRRGVRATVRWGLAVVLCAGLGGGSAAYLTSLHRHEVPGLSTKSDGRWKYPRLTLPALRAGEPQPGDPANSAGTHFADPRDLLIPAPEGAKPDKALPGGVVPVDRYLAEYGEDDRAGLRDGLDVAGLRQVTARGWTMPDGTHARVYLLRFPSSGLAASYLGASLRAATDRPGTEPGGSSLSGRDPRWEPFPSAYVLGSGTAYEEKAPFGARQVRHGYVRMGDTLAFVITDHAGRNPAVPFRQTMILQGQLLA